jgi:hypothetical protein
MKIPKKFPVLGIAADGDIVMFTGVSKNGRCLKGVCIAATPTREHAVGEYMKDWIPRCFKLYEGTVTVGPFKLE